MTSKDLVAEILRHHPNRGPAERVLKEFLDMRFRIIELCHQRRQVAEIEPLLLDLLHGLTRVDRGSSPEQVSSRLARPSLLTLRHPPFTLLWECAAMESQGRVLGPATTNFNDYVGTVAADDAAAVMDRPSLYELAQIDRDRYTIVGIELNVDGPTTAAVYAFDRLEHSIARLEQIVELGLSRGEIPVVRFDIPEIDAGDFIRHAFKRISVQLLVHDLRDQALKVSEPSSAKADEARGSKPH
jgi:hypothetical protein